MDIIKKIVVMFASMFVFLFTPIFSLSAAIIKLLFKKDVYDWNRDKKQNFLIYSLRKNWWSHTDASQHNRTFANFVLPTLIAFTVFVVYTFLSGVYFSMTDWTGLNTGSETFVWFENYKLIFKDYGYAYSLYRTAFYSVISIVVINFVAFFLAMLVTQNLKLKNLYRAGFFLPNLIGGLVLGYIWQFVFNKVITTLGPSFETSILSSGETALWGLIIVVTWQYAGYIMMIYIAALQNVPVDLIEASKIDGANAFQRLRAITLPLVAQAFTVSMFLTLVTSFKQYDTVMSLTQGGPGTLIPTWLANIFGLGYTPAANSNELIAINIYKEAFQKYQLGYGQAKAIIFFLFLLAISLLQVYYNKRKEVEM